MTTDTIPTIEREIKYSRQDRDYACYVNGQYIGSRANYSDAETLCDQVAYDLIADGQCATATELDGGSSAEEIAADAPITPARHWSHDAGCGGTVPCGCDAEGRLYCPNCLGNHELKDCPNNPPTHHAPTAPILAPALLAEADAALSTCPGAFDVCGAEAHPSYAPFCQRCALALQRVAVAAYVQRLADDLGLACSFCGEAHDAGDCPLRRPLIVPGPRACGCCGGAHHIQQCGELRAALFAKAEVFYAVAA